MEEEKFTFSEETDAIETVNPEDEVKEEVQEEEPVNTTPSVEETTENKPKKDPRNTVILVLCIIILILLAVVAVLYLTKDIRNGGNKTATTKTNEITTRVKENVYEYEGLNEEIVDPIDHELQEGFTSEEHYTYMIKGTEHKIDIYTYVDEIEEESQNNFGHKVLLIDDKTYPKTEKINRALEDIWDGWNGSVYYNQEMSKVMKGEDGKEYFILVLNGFVGGGYLHDLYIINESNQIIANISYDGGFYINNSEMIYNNGFVSVEEEQFKVVIPTDNEEEYDKAQELIGTIYEDKVTLEKGEIISGSWAGAR